jgi:NAD+ synthase
LDYAGTSEHIVKWLNDYCEKAGLVGFVVGVSGGVDSALTSTLCAKTGKKTILVNMPIRQTEREYQLATDHISDLERKFSNVKKTEIELTGLFEMFEKTYPTDIVKNQLSMANTRARLRMTTLYAVAQTNSCLVVGTGNKVEDFGVGFFTKYGDGGVDLSPIADLTKTQVKELANSIGVINAIIVAKPTDGLWGDARSDEDQLGASYPELEWAMEFSGDESTLSERQIEVLKIFRRLNALNKHKMEPIPVCIVPTKYH